MLFYSDNKWAKLIIYFEILIQIVARWLAGIDNLINIELITIPKQTAACTERSFSQNYFNATIHLRKSKIMALPLSVTSVSRYRLSVAHPFFVQHRLLQFFACLFCFVAALAHSSTARRSFAESGILMLRICSKLRQIPTVLYYRDVPSVSSDFRVPFASDFFSSLGFFHAFLYFSLVSSSFLDHDIMFSTRYIPSVSFLSHVNLED